VAIVFSQIAFARQHFSIGYHVDTLMRTPTQSLFHAADTNPETLLAASKQTLLRVGFVMSTEVGLNTRRNGSSPTGGNRMDLSKACHLFPVVSKRACGRSSMSPPASPKALSMPSSYALKRFFIARSAFWRASLM